MFDIFKKLIDSDRILKMQLRQYQEDLILEDTVPANSSRVGSVSISSLGDFYLLYMTGHFTTLYLDGGDIKDDGISHLRAKMVDNSNARNLFNDYIPLDLFLSPGRTKSSTSTTLLTDPVSNNLFYPQSFMYMFTLSSEIQFEVKNDSDADNSYAIRFHGIRFPESRKAKFNKA